MPEPGEPSGEPDATTARYGDGDGDGAESVDLGLQMMKQGRPRDPAGAQRLLARLEERLLDRPSSSAPSSSSSSPGSGPPRYRPIEKIGAGGLGTVYAAFDSQLDRRVAIKFLHAGSATPTARDRFIREAKAMARVAHPNVVAVHDVGTIDDEIFIAMELVDGVTLSSWWRAEPRTWRQVRDVMVEAGRGLCAAHEAGLVHRDFKPPNVLVGVDGRARVLDFGLARGLRGPAIARAIPPRGTVSVDAQLTDPDTLMGTPAYMAPEQIMGGEVGPAADQFSFCATLFEGVYRQRAFRGSDVMEVLRAVIEGQVTPVPAGAKVPAWLHRVIMRGLASQPEQRFESMAAVLEALQHDRRARRRGWKVLVATAVVAAGLTAGGLWMTRPVPTEADRAVVAELSERTRAAAQARSFLYPPPRQPDEPTAYQLLRKLELMSGTAAPIATAAAEELRAEIAATLLRLGDELWDRDGGRAFASDYYAMAIVFDPEIDRRALTRSTLSRGELLSLRERAEQGDFSAAEMVAGESLAVLAEDDPDRRAQRLAALYQQPNAPSPTTTARLTGLLGTDQMAAAGRGARGRGRAEGAAGEGTGDPMLAEGEVEAGAPPEGEPSTDGASGGEVEGEPATTSEAGAASEPASAGPTEDHRALTKAAVAALRRGERAVAEAKLHRALRAKSNYAPALAGLARLHFDEGRNHQAARYAQRAVAAAPRKAEYRVLLGDAHYKALDYNKAKAQYEEAKTLGSTVAEQRLSMLRARLGE